jgi:hypothetical protein
VVGDGGVKGMVCGVWCVVCGGRMVSEEVRVG